MSREPHAVPFINLPVDESRTFVQLALQSFVRLVRDQKVQTLDICPEVEDCTLFSGISSSWESLSARATDL